MKRGSHSGRMRKRTERWDDCVADANIQETMSWNCRFSPDLEMVAPETLHRDSFAFCKIGNPTKPVKCPRRAIARQQAFGVATGLCGILKRVYSECMPHPRNAFVKTSATSVQPAIKVRYHHSRLPNLLPRSRIRSAVDRLVTRLKCRMMRGEAG